VPRDRVPRWRDGDQRSDPSREARERERRFAEPIWARAKELRAEKRRENYEQYQEQAYRDSTWQYPENVRLRTLPPIQVITRLEQKAVAALKEQNDRSLLAELFDPNYIYNQSPLIPDQPIRNSLSNETAKLVAEVLRGDFKHSGGRPKGRKDPRGRPLRRRVHVAAAYIRFLSAALRAAYPGQSRREVRGRALYMASKKYRLAEDTIKNYAGLPLDRRVRLDFGSGL
jgi:hypothetical protein